MVYLIGHFTMRFMSVLLCMKRCFVLLRCIGHLGAYVMDELITYREIFCLDKMRYMPWCLCRRIHLASERCILGHFDTYILGRCIIEIIWGYIEWFDAYALHERIIYVKIYFNASNIKYIERCFLLDIKYKMHQALLDTFILADVS